MNCAPSRAARAKGGLAAWPTNGASFFRERAARSTAFSTSLAEAGARPGADGPVGASLSAIRFSRKRPGANASSRTSPGASPTDGCTVFSFDYRGYGNSPGETDDVDVAGLERDVLDACGLLRKRGCGRIALVGVRWGAALAERVAASREDVDALFFVQPVIAWRKTLMAALRSNVAGQYAIFKKAVMTREEIVKELLAGGDCVRSGYRMNNIDGYIISRLFFEQSEAVSMPLALGVLRPKNRRFRYPRGGGVGRPGMRRPRRRVPGGGRLMRRRHGDRGLQVLDQ